MHHRPATKISKNQNGMVWLTRWRNSTGSIYEMWHWTLVTPYLCFVTHHLSQGMEGWCYNMCDISCRSVYFVFYILLPIPMTQCEAIDHGYSRLMLMKYDLLMIIAHYYLWLCPLRNLCSLSTVWQSRPIICHVTSLRYRSDCSLGLEMEHVIDVDGESWGDWTQEELKVVYMETWKFDHDDRVQKEHDQRMRERWYVH